MAKTLFEKVWDNHVVREVLGEPALLYIDLHLVHEVTSPQAFDSLRLADTPVRRPDLTVSTIDHGVPTADRALGIKDPLSKKQIDTLISNCEENDILLFGIDDPRQGIVHVIGPEQGITQPGMTIVCGDSHTATHGAFGALAFGIGTSEVEHVLATQSLPQSKPKAMAITVDGELGRGVTAKDIILEVLRQLTVKGGVGKVMEYAGEGVATLTVPERATITNMGAELGATTSIFPSDENTRRYRLGQAVRKLSAPQSSHALLQEIALPFLRQLVAKTGENAHLAVNIGDVALVIADIESTEALRVVSEVGRQERLYCTAVGKCLLAFGNGTIPDKLPRLTQHTITEQLQLENHLEKIRKQGYAIDDEEKTIGIRCLAAPVYDATEKAIASIGISGPASRLTMDKLYPLTEIIMQEASAFSGILGH